MLNVSPEAKQLKAKGKRSRGRGLSSLSVGSEKGKDELSEAQRNRKKFVDKPHSIPVRLASPDRVSSELACRS